MLIFCIKRQFYFWIEIQFTWALFIELLHFLTALVIPSGSLKIAEEKTTTSGSHLISSSRLFALIPPSMAISHFGFLSSTSFLALFNRRTIP